MKMIAFKKAVLLINLGTPASFETKDVRKYLTEFLNDPYVIDVPLIKRFFLVNFVIIPFRTANSANMYKKIWLKDGSPLLVNSIALKQKLQEKMSNEYYVDLAMRYGNPSIKDALLRIKKSDVGELFILPLFPQFAYATTLSVKSKVKQLIKELNIKQKVYFIENFYNNNGLIDSFVESVKKYSIDDYDHVLFSFHGLPERQIIKAKKQNLPCYKEQSYEMARLIAGKIKIPQNKYTVCFQSRLGKEPWIQPYTVDVVKQLAEKGNKNVLVFCPSFVCDCLETIYEICIEYNKEFKAHGGKHLQLVEGLNDQAIWVNALKDIILMPELKPG